MVNSTTPVVFNLRLYHDKAVREARNSERLDARISPHLSPFSTLVFAMGNYWKPGCLDAVLKMLKYTHEYGYEVALYEERDRCFSPYDALGTMRNIGYMKAIEEGWEFILYVDNDVRPAEDVLVRLLQRYVPIVSPKIVYVDGQNHGLDMPRMPEGKGLALIGSCVLSCLLVKTSVFLPWANGGFWGNAIGDDEEYHFRRLALTGHRPFVDTDIVVECVEPPHFPLDKRKEIDSQMRPGGGLWTPVLYGAHVS